MSRSKSEMRRSVLDARAGLSPFVLAQHNAELAEWMYRLPVELDPGDVVAAYVATRAEPGGTAMLDALVDRDLRVLLPIVPEGEPTRLQWGEYQDESSLDRGRWGLLEPMGHRLDPDALHQAKLILVPAVAADLTGARLGRGAGYYDRTLVAVDAPVVAVVHDDELFDDGVPHEANDVPMDWVLTPGRGFCRVATPTG
ncbi:5-formyltetrahydrofolate cyclo-ligase [Gordonia hydrophobica]|uniref:5-formyltetrahydrofolate cyclo-ligase n=1 Tax=Gordonia hydrophobica TaxID=40516 RepID=A0ABZ2U5B6_9ACTN|nr:5-formyltetrahydrofolate cyclo-ligase [Gordonia hydrophobica]MBM7367348.1 5-formyltetrahydrofolate cyclo-ligase [Gordonia hydrophobica]